MAIYHCSIKIFSRGKGASAVAKSAYRAAERIRSEYDGNTYDYTRKRGIIHKEILLPEYAPDEYYDRFVLWNAVEKSERNSNAQLAREIEVSLPVELTLEQNISLAREYVKRQFVDSGMCADLCIHDTNGTNPHAHIMLTMRPINEDGTWGAKSKKEYILDDNGERIRLKSGALKTRKICTVDWNEPTKAEEWRSAWADALNAALEHESISQRVDHRSYARQGIEQIPTVHLGVAASQLEKRGIRTERGNQNREIEITNQHLRQLRARIMKAKNALYALPITDSPTMVSMMNHIADGKNLNTRYNKIANLKTQASVLMFLQQNKVFDMAQLVEKIEKMNGEFYEVSNSLKKVDRRLETLNAHLTECDKLNQHKVVYQKYAQLNPKKRGAFLEKHSDEIQSYRDAKQHLDTVMNGRAGLPVKSWKAERDKLTAERLMLCEDYYRLKDETRNVELLRKGAENIMRDSIPIARHHKSYERE